MGRGRGSVYLTHTALVLLASTASANPNLWHVSLDYGPAPSPEDSPPFSAHATRNKALLPFQIVGVVGSYLASVLIIGTLLLTVGRTLRKRAQTAVVKPTELVKHYQRTFDPSPISPSSAKSWYSPRRLKGRKSSTSSMRSGISNPTSPGMDSVVSFDTNVIEADKQKRQEEMERLYAAVMAHDDPKAQQQSTVRTTELSQPQPGYPRGQPSPGVPPDFSRKLPPRLITDAPGLRHLQAPDYYSHSGPASPRSPGTPKSPVRAIYPPDAPMPPLPSSPTSPLRAGYPTAPLSPNYVPVTRSSQQELQATRASRSSSLGSVRTVGSQSGGTKKLRKSLRHLKISAPLRSSAGDDNSDGARTPLSPRLYMDPGIPPEPPTARTTDSQYAPPTPGTAKSWRYGEEHDTEDEEMDQIRDLPRAHPNRASSYLYDNAPQALTTTASTRADPTGTTPQNRLPVASTSNTLPFRQMAAQREPTSRPPHPSSSNPLSPVGLSWNQGYPLSAGPVKTTFLETRRDPSGGMGGPRTGLATPYSPYMPFTPLTPVTPHLTSRAERRQRQREDRAVRGAVVEEDLVQEEADLWSSGY